MLESVRKIAKQNPKSLIGRAFQFAENAYSGKKRADGQPYLNHAMATAEFLHQWHLDENTITAGLLHDVPAISKFSVADIRKEFGDDIAFLVDGMNKLSIIQYRNQASAKIENMRKMILALSGDLRIIFIKLANRLDNLKTQDGLAPEQKNILARETSEIYAPLASLIGMQNLAGEIHDLCFPTLYPKEYDWLVKNIKDKYEERHNYLVRFKPQLEKLLKENKIEPVFIDFRAKRYSSLYFKLLRYDMDLSKIYDLVCTWVVMKEINECYEALGIIHHAWPPLPGRIKDYIATPKPTGYRSLHTTIIGPENKHIEIQIHTENMHDENKNGLAAHWLYKQRIEKGSEKTTRQSLLKQVPLIRHLRRWQSNNSNNQEKSYQEFIEAMKIDFFKDRIFTITPQGDVIDLPKGSTPVDFAYKIHSDVGNCAVRAEVNGKICPLNVELKSGDLIKIITQKGKKPSEEWLDFIKTSHAREQVKLFLNKKKLEFEKKLF